MSAASRAMARAFALTAVSAGLAACSDYLARRDTLTLGTGEAVQANMAMHTIDPWPPRSRRIDPYTDGERLQHAIERYRNPVVSPTGGTPTAPFGGSAPPATPATPSAPPASP